MIAAPVQCDVDGVPKGLHDSRIVFGFWWGARELNPGPHGPEALQRSVRTESQEAVRVRCIRALSPSSVTRCRWMPPRLLHGRDGSSSQTSHRAPAIPNDPKLSGWSDQVRRRPRYQLCRTCLSSHHGTTPVLALQCAIRTIPRGRPLRIGSSCEAISSILMLNHPMRSTISSHTPMEPPDGVGTRKSDTEHCTPRRGWVESRPGASRAREGLTVLRRASSGLK